MSGYFASLFGGANSTLNKDINATGSLAGFAAGQGTGDISAADKFWKSILSGDSSKIGQALAPAVSANQQQGQGAKNTLAQFGTRSGGTAAAGAGIDAAGRGNMINMIGGMQTGAASNLGSMGQNLLQAGMQGYGQEAQLSQERMKNWANSILGQGISSGIGTMEGFGLGTAMNQMGSDTFGAMMRGRGGRSGYGGYGGNGW